MTICSQIKGYARNHERIADFSSLLAVALLFSTILIVIDYQASIFSWTQQSILLHGPAVILLLVLDVFLIIMLLNIGSTRLEGPGDNQSDRCFGTFRGRRHGGFNLGTAFRNWVQHIEQVNKKHR
ncbi:cell division protein BolA [Sedimenticola selenatireducens]|uniref:Cell division protein BolA n=1 Tax=Sedimenticola selenatireducens TaxID=191960 RepID=A0A2N6CSJ5_9GAMM|nr:cell division protein BolA [Sedimenticola selenatireducens]PLX60062.1 MAG: cell division protein BolA [Sedimenticola selenatireducens]